MSRNTIIWIVVAVVVVLLLLALLWTAMKKGAQKKQEKRRDEAENIRGDAAAQERTVRGMRPRRPSRRRSRARPERSQIAGPPRQRSWSCKPTSVVSTRPANEPSSVSASAPPTRSTRTCSTRAIERVAATTAVTTAILTAVAVTSRNQGTGPAAGSTPRAESTRIRNALT